MAQLSKKEELRHHVKSHLVEIVAAVNAGLRGKNLDRLEPTLTRIASGGKLPHWYARLKVEQTLPNLDGKTIGSVIEMLLVAVLESNTFVGMSAPPLHIAPAKGVDLPDLDLGIKSPSENYCTSEPFFSAYERLLGNEHDCLVLLTDYQTAKNNPPLRLQITKFQYLRGSEIADEVLCRIAKLHRAWLLDQNQAWATKMFRFLAYVNQGDWRARQLLKIVRNMQDENAVEKCIAEIPKKFELDNVRLAKKNSLPISEDDLQAILSIRRIRPSVAAIIDAADNWVVESQRDIGRFPNENELQRLLKGPLDGKIGMSFALQWRYNFKKTFGIYQKTQADKGAVTDIADLDVDSGL